MNMPDTMPEWHEALLARLISHRVANPAFTFSTRVTLDDRFRAGYWFQGTENYLFCGPFKVNEPNNKTKTIGLMLKALKNHTVSARYVIVFGAPICQPNLPFYQEVLSRLGVVEKPDTTYYEIPIEMEQFDQVMEDFTGRFIPLVREIVAQFGYEDQFLVHEADFQKSMTKIEQRKKDGLIDIPLLQELTEAATIVSASSTLYVDPAAWLVGAHWSGEDMTPRFVAEGRWENGYDDRFQDQVNAVELGDRIAIKTSFTQKHELPFDNLGKTASCMGIKASGIVTANPGDGKHLTVEWNPLFQPFTVYHYTYRATIARINAVKFPYVIDWIFKGVKQPLMANVQVGVASGQTDDDSTIIDRYGPAPRNVIFFGPPGTGKTRTLLEEILPAYIDDAVDAPEPVKLAVITTEMSWFEVIAAALIGLAPTPVKVKQIITHPFVTAKFKDSVAPTHLTQMVWSVLQNHATIDSVTVKTNIDNRVEPLVFDKNAQSEWALLPDWKSIAPELQDIYDKLTSSHPLPATESQRYEFVTFHPSFSYEDFVEGLRPIQSDQDDGSRIVEIKPSDGALKRICRRAKNDPDRRYALVIDEINRGNISKIFGELITLIEPDKRVRYDAQGRKVIGLEVTLPCTAELFGVPENVDFYGTMNTSDRSIALVDLALRRRFLFRQVAPDPQVIRGFDGNGLISADDNGTDIDLRRILQVINARLHILRGRDAQIGHAYLTSVKSERELDGAFRDKIIPLLQEYFFGDWAGIAQILTVKKNAPRFLRSNTPKLNDLFLSQLDDSDELGQGLIWNITKKFESESFRSLYESVPDSALEIF